MIFIIYVIPAGLRYAPRDMADLTEKQKNTLILVVANAYKFGSESVRSALSFLIEQTGEACKTDRCVQILFTQLLHIFTAEQKQWIVQMFPFMRILFTAGYCATESVNAADIGRLFDWVFKVALDHESKVVKLQILYNHKMKVSTRLMSRLHGREKRLSVLGGYKRDSARNAALLFIEQNRRQKKLHDADLKKLKGEINEAKAQASRYFQELMHLYGPVSYANHTADLIEHSSGEQPAQRLRLEEPVDDTPLVSPQSLHSIATANAREQERLSQSIACSRNATTEGVAILHQRADEILQAFMLTAKNTINSLQKLAVDEITLVRNQEAAEQIMARYRSMVISVLAQVDVVDDFRSK